MITLLTDQACIILPDYLVKIGNDYAENDLVIVYNKNFPEQEVAMFAIFIATGQYPI